MITKLNKDFALRYIAFDGTEFISRSECEDYEKHLNEGELKEFEVWIEGYLATGMDGIPARAQCLAYRIKANSFEEAIKRWYYSDASNESGWGPLRQYNGHYSLYGCRIYQTEREARKAFG